MILRTSEEAHISWTWSFDTTPLSLDHNTEALSKEIARSCPQSASAIQKHPVFRRKFHVNERRNAEMILNPNEMYGL